MLTVKWDDSHMHTSYADVCKVLCTHDEVILHFGVSQARQPGQEGQTVKLETGIILTPSTAKRLSLALNQKLPQNELQYKSAQPDLSKGAEPIALRRLPFAPQNELSAEKANLLSQLVHNLQVDYGLEGSVKFYRKTLLPYRFLLTMSKNSLGQNPHKRILGVCERLDMPEVFLDAFKEHLAVANYLHFGFEEKKDTCHYKAYLEFWTTWDDEIINRPDRREPFLLYLGFKWDAADNTKRVLTKYTCYPSLSPEAIMGRLSENYRDSEFRNPFETAKTILNIALRKIAYNNIIYLDVVEENNPRKSFDLNLYRAKIRLNDIHPLLLKMSRYYSIPSKKFNEIYEKFNDKIVGHISGGIDNKGSDFLTVYYRA